MHGVDVKADRAVELARVVCISPQERYVRRFHGSSLEPARMGSLPSSGWGQWVTACSQTGFCSKNILWVKCFKRPPGGGSGIAALGSPLSAVLRLHIHAHAIARI